MADITSKTVQLDNCPIHLTIMGQGPALFLIHGWSNDWRGWTPLANILKKHYTLYLVDLPGFGDTPPLTNNTLDNTVKVIHQLLTQENIKPQAILGASLGTIITSRLCHRYPQTTPHVILMGAVISDQTSFQLPSLIYFKLLSMAHKLTLTQKLLKLLVTNRLSAYTVEKFLNAYQFNKELVDLYSLPGKKKVDGRAYIEIGISAKQYNIKKFLDKTKLQTLLIYGDHERYTKPAKVQTYLKSLDHPNLELKIISKCGHNPAYEQSQKTAKLIQSFLTH